MLKLVLPALRAIPWLVVLPVLKRRRALPNLVRTLWMPARVEVRDLALERDVVSLVRVLFRMRKVVADDNCLERSLVTYRFLLKLNAEPQLVVAMREGDAEPRGHVWVVVDGEPVRESPDLLRELVPIMVFDARGSLAEVPAPAGLPEADPVGDHPQRVPGEPNGAPDVRRREA
jgi:hypothetical protein